MANFLVRRNQKKPPDDGREYRKATGEGTNIDPFIFANKLVGDIIVDSNEGQSLRTSDTNQEQLMSDILKELKIMNIHLALMTDNVITKTEI